MELAVEESPKFKDLLYSSLLISWNQFNHTLMQKTFSEFNRRSYQNFLDIVSSISKLWM